MGVLWAAQRTTLALLLALLGSMALSEDALAYSHEDVEKHYALELPGSWQLVQGNILPSPTPFDVVFQSTDGPMVVMTGGTNDLLAADTQDYVSSQGNILKGLMRSGPGLDVESTELVVRDVAGRPAAEVLSLLKANGVEISFRVIIFSSSYHRMVYFVGTMAPQELTEVTDGIYESIVQSFLVTDELSGFALLRGYTLIATVGVLASLPLLVVGFLLLQRRRRRRHRVEAFLRLTQRTAGGYGSTPLAQPVALGAGGNLLPPPPPPEELE